MKLIKLIAKNFKILFRSRSAALIILLGPLFIMIIAGMAFNSAGAFDLTIGVHSPSETQKALEVTDALDKEYEVLIFLTTTECVAALEEGRIHACIEYPDEFVVAQGRRNEIVMFVDSSKTSIVEVIKSSLVRIIGSEQQRISSDLTGVLVDTMDATVNLLDLTRSQELASVLSRSGEVSTQLASITAKVGGINLSYNPEAFNLAGIRFLAEEIDSQASNLKYEAEDALDELSSFADNIYDANISEELNNEASDAIEYVITTRAELAETLDGLDANREDMLNVIRHSQEQLDLITKQLDAARMENDAIGQGINTQKAELDAVKAVVADADAKLAGGIDRLTSVAVTNVTSIVQPISLTTQTVVTNITRLNYIFPTLMMLVIMFVSIMISSTLIIAEKRSPARFRMFTTPTKDITFLISTLVTVLILIALQILVILLVAQLGFGIEVGGNALNIVLVLFIASFVFIFIGMIVGYVFSSEQSSVLASISIGSLFLLISDLILPLESMPPLMQRIVEQTPFILSTDVLRRVVIFEATLPEVGLQTAILSGYVIAFLLCIIIVRKIAKSLYIINHARK